ncbi:MAG: DUF4139 domain-containing protein [Pseudanabaenaceae cyanobacterium]
MSIAQLHSRIDQVKVYAKGSTVTRLANLTDITQQTHQTSDQGSNQDAPHDSLAPDFEVEIVDLPLALDDASVRVRLRSNDPGITDSIANHIIVTDVRVGLSVPQGAEIVTSSLETEIRTAQAEVDHLEDLESQIELEIAILHQLDLPQRPIGEQGKAPPPSPMGARLALANFKDQQKRLHSQEKRQVQEKLRQAKEHLVDLQQQQLLASNANVAQKHELRKTIIARIHRVHQPTEALSSAVHLELDQIQLVAEYFVNGAQWQPTYVCHLNSVTNTAMIAVRGMIAQCTGEDWQGVKIELSTAQPSTWCELPELPALRLGRSQTVAGSKAWRSPPAGSELLFTDYDDQKKFLTTTNHTEQLKKQLRAQSPEAWQIPQVSGLMDLAEFPFFQYILSSVGTGPEASLAASSNVGFQSGSNFSVTNSITKKAQVPKSFRGSDRDHYHEELDITLGSQLDESPEPVLGRSAPVPSAAPMPQSLTTAPPRYVAREFKSRGRGVLSESAPAMFSDPGDQTKPDIENQIENHIKNYGVMRLATPSDLVNRGKLTIPEPEALYLESLKRWQVKVDFDITEVLGTASIKTLGTGNNSLSGVPERIRQEVGNFDFVYVGTGRIDVPADGQYHSVPLLQENAEIDLRYVVVPRENTNVFRIAQLRNPLSAPLLAGPADIYVDGAYLFSTEITTVPPRGQMELALGVEQSIKVARNTSFKEGRSSMSLVAFNELRHSIHIAITNPMAKAARIEVRERIPIAQPDAKVDVTITRVIPDWEKYEQQERNEPIKGGYRWRIQVPAGVTKELMIDYTIKTFVDQELVNGNRREN